MKNIVVKGLKGSFKYYFDGRVNVPTILKERSCPAALFNDARIVVYSENSKPQCTVRWETVTFTYHATSNLNLTDIFVANNYTMLYIKVKKGNKK